MRHILVLLGQPEKSAVAERSFETGHSIDCSSIALLDKARYIDRLIREAIEIRRYPTNFNKDGRFSLSLFCYPATIMTSRREIYHPLTSPSPHLHWLALSISYGPRIGMQMRRFGSIVTSENIGSFKKSFTTLKKYINLFRGHVQCLEVS
jgi:hypothetical protein